MFCRHVVDLRFSACKTETMRPHYKFYFFLTCGWTLFCAFSALAQPPQLTALSAGRKVSLRGLSVVNDTVFWVSGSGGQVGRSTNGGKTIEWQTIPGQEKRDFRDIEALDENTALVLAVAEPGLMLKTTNAGKDWYPVFQDPSPGVFLDAFAFAKTAQGLEAWAIGDPLPQVKGKDTSYPLYALYSSNGGDTWEKKNTGIYLEKDEAFFASSGSNLVVLASGKVLAVTGGKKARLLHWQQDKFSVTDLPLLQGQASTGANALALAPNQKNAFVVGGNFQAPAMVSPWGYRSGLAYVDASILVACGTSGTDYSKDGGKTWVALDKTGYHVVKTSPAGRVVYLAGGNGRIAKITGL
ncbi:MAG: hypothetical protein EAZ62_03360 [Sphingobacteriia bacterium]|nr:MAG: hypothetical protein EAZ62_03360 [Sphingobacteriia bacterium]